MSDSTLDQLRRSIPPLFAFLAAFGIGVVNWREQMLRDGDTYWHLVVGRWILDHGQVPHRDFLSYTATGKPWIAHEWLSEVVMALVYQAGGWTALVAVWSLVFALTLYLLAHHLGRFLGPLATAALLGLAGFSLLIVLLVRPHVLALPLVEFWTAQLVIARSRSRAPPWALVPLMTLWANLHGSFVLGLGLTGLLGLEAALKERGSRREVILRWGLFTLAATVAALVTPNFPGGFLLPFRFLTMETMFSLISEWQSPNFQHLDPLEIILLVSLLFGFGRGLKLPLFRLFLVVALIYSAFQHIRNEAMVGLIGSLLIAEPLGQHLKSRPFRQLAGWRSAAQFELTVGAPALLAIAAFLVLKPVVRIPDPATPSAAIDHVPPALRARPVFNEYSFGGYLIFQGIRPFIDGRTDMYGGEFLKTYVDSASANGKVLWDTFRKYDVAWTVMPPTNALVTVLDASPDWQRLYADDTAVVQVRKAVLAELPNAPAKAP